MFSLAVAIGIYSYLIFIFGLLGILYQVNIYILTLFSILVFIVTRSRNNKLFKLNLFLLLKQLNKDKISLYLLILLIIQIFVNLIGALGPELSFDALWYHLTLPKIYLSSHSIYFIPGGLLYYSAMPKLVEMLYVFGLSTGIEEFPKFIHLGFGLLVIGAIYGLSREFMDRKLSLIASLIFYSSLTVGWESITAYIDLGRTFYEVVALWAFIKWIRHKKNIWLYFSGILLGLAIAAKIVSFVSLFIFLLLIGYYLYNSNQKKKEIIKAMISYFVAALIPPLPWLMFSFFNTGNPIYPIGNVLNADYSFFQIQSFFSNFFNIFLFSSDPINPVYILIFPLIITMYKKSNKYFKILTIYFIFAIVFSILLYKIGGNRFALPYTGGFAVLCSLTINLVKDKYIKKILIICVILVTFSSLFYRTLANAKYLPVIFGQISKNEFLSNNLDYGFGDFYDTDLYFKQNITKNDKVLLFGFHNLFYVDFPYIDSSWVKKGDYFNYIAVQNSEIPKRFKNWKMIYQNPKTLIKLYSLEKEKCQY